MAKKSKLANDLEKISMQLSSLRGDVIDPHPGHPKAWRKCVICGRPHSAAQHKSHGEGAYRRTHKGG